MIFMKYIIVCAIQDLDISWGWLRLWGLRIVHFGVVYGVFVLGESGAFSRGWRMVEISAVFRGLLVGSWKWSISHMFIWGLGLSCTPFPAVWGLPVLLWWFGWVGVCSSFVLYSAKVCKLIEVMVVTIITYYKVEYC